MPEFLWYGEAGPLLPSSQEELRDLAGGMESSVRMSLADSSVGLFDPVSGVSADINSIRVEGIKRSLRWVSGLMIGFFLHVFVFC